MLLNNFIKDSYNKYFVGYFLFFLLSFLAFYPGIYGYDVPLQVCEVLDGSVTLSSHQPLLHTFLISFFVKIGGLIFKDYNIGLAIYVFLVGVFTCCVLTKLHIWISENGGEKTSNLYILVFRV